MKYMSLLAILLMVVAGVLAVAVSVPVATAVFFIAWGVWFAAIVYKM